MSEERLKNCFVENLGIEPAQVVDGLQYNSIPQWDSVGHMALVAGLEDTFDVMFDTDEIVGMSSVAIARETLQKKGVAF